MCTEPDWDRTVTEQTGFHLFLLAHLDFERFYNLVNFVLKMNPSFKRTKCSNMVKMTLSKGLNKRNYNLDKMTSKVNICSVRFLSLPVW